MEDEDVENTFVFERVFWLRSISTGETEEYTEEDDDDGTSVSSPSIELSSPLSVL